MENMKIISGDLGGTKILSALLEDSKITDRVKIPTDSKSGAEGIVKLLVGSINQLLLQNNLTEKDMTAISIGVPGSVDFNKGIIAFAPNICGGIKNFNIKKSLMKYFHIPIFIENDVNLAALGIKKFEIKKTSKDFLVVSIGTGIGGALVLDDKIYRGSHYYAGEIGHITVDLKGPICGCGKHGCLEAYFSRSAIVKAIKTDIKSGSRSVLSKYVKQNEKIKSKMLKTAVKEKDELVIRHLKNAAEIIGYKLGNICNLLDINRIVLSGGVIEALSEFMLPKIKNAFNKTATKEVKGYVEITATQLGDDAALFGGWVLAEESE